MKKSEFARISSSIAARLVEMGLPLQQESHDSLVALATRTDAEYFTEVRASFHTDPKSRWSEQAVLTVSSDNDYNRKADEETGDITTTSTVKVSLRLSSWEGRPSAELLQHLELARKAVAAAQTIEDEFAFPYTYVVRTAAEEAERLAKEEAENKRRKVQRLSEYPSKGLRAGGNARQLSREIFAGCEDGSYEVSHGDKTFRVVLRPGTASVRRLS